MFKIRVNGEDKELADVDPDMPLLWLIRDVLELTGTKYSCGTGLCGTCTVQLDGSPIRACLTPAKDAEGMSLTTIEGLSGKHADALRDAWEKYQVPQCGFCQAGQLISAEHLLRSNSNAEVSSEQLENAMAGNLCRCGTYNRINQAIHSANQELKND